MKHYFLVIFIAFFVALGFCACQSNPLINKLEEASKQTRAREQKRWEAVEKKLLADSNLLKEYTAQRSDFNKSSLINKTAPAEVIVAERFLQIFRDNTPLTGLSGRNSSLTVKRTESVWVERAAILDFVNTILKNDSIDGIRLYFAQYPDNASSIDAGLDASCNGRKTIVFTATRKMPDGRTRVDMFLPKPRGPVKGPTDGLYVYDYNSLCPEECSGGTLGGNP